MGGIGKRVRFWYNGNTHQRDWNPLAARAERSAKMQEIMTDHQFDAILKMAIKIVEASKSREDAIQSLREILDDNQRQ